MKKKDAATPPNPAPHVDEDDVKIFTAIALYQLLNKDATMLTDAMLERIPGAAAKIGLATAVALASKFE